MNLELRNIGKHNDSETLELRSQRLDVHFIGKHKVSETLSSETLENIMILRPWYPQGPQGTSRDPLDSLENIAFGDPGTPQGPARDLQGP